MTSHTKFDLAKIIDKDVTTFDIAVQLLVVVEIVQSLRVSFRKSERVSQVRSTGGDQEQKPWKRTFSASAMIKRI